MQTVSKSLQNKDLQNTYMYVGARWLIEFKTRTEKMWDVVKQSEYGVGKSEAPHQREKTTVKMERGETKMTGDTSL